jgi:hypothetical protein
MGSLQDLRKFHSYLLQKLELPSSRGLLLHTATQGKKERVILNLEELAKDSSCSRADLEKLLEESLKLHPAIAKWGSSYTYRSGNIN